MGLQTSEVVSSFKLLQQPEVIFGILGQHYSGWGQFFFCIEEFFSDGGSFLFLFWCTFTSTGGSFRSMIVSFSVLRDFFMNVSQFWNNVLGGGVPGWGYSLPLLLPAMFILLNQPVITKGTDF